MTHTGPKGLAIALALVALPSLIIAADAVDEPFTRTFSSSTLVGADHKLDLPSGLYRVTWSAQDTDDISDGCVSLSVDSDGPDGVYRSLVDHDYDGASGASYEHEIKLPAGVHRLDFRSHQCDWTVTLTWVAESPPLPDYSRLPGVAMVADLQEPVDRNMYFGGFAFDDIYLFRGWDPSHGWELWRSDGTADGTMLLADSKPGGASWRGSNVATTEDAIFFTANDGQYGDELWISDGTPEGTRMIKDVRKGERGSSPGSGVDIDGIVFYSAVGAGGPALWRTDGTGPGTVQVVAMGEKRRMLDTGPRVESRAGDRILFSRGDLGGLWVSDGTKGSARRIWRGEVDSPVIPFDSRAIFVGGRRLWITDGTRKGTRLVKGGRSALDPEYLMVVGARLFFVATDERRDEAVNLWVSDGTLDGTSIVVPFKHASVYDDLYLSRQVLHDRLVYLANPTDRPPPFSRSESPMDLWVSDGTAAETTCVGSFELADLGPTIGDDLFFMADDGTRGLGLWATDGSSANTRLVVDLGLSGLDEVVGMTAVGDRLFIQTYEDFDWRLWVVTLDEASSAATSTLAPRRCDGRGRTIDGPQGAAIR